MLRNNGSIEFEVARQMPNQQHPEPFILLGSPPNFPQSSVHQISPPGSLNNIDFHRLHEHQDGTTLYRLPYYTNQVHPVGNLELGIPARSNFYNPYVNSACGGRMFSGPINRSSMDQLPSSINFRASASHVGGYGMNGFAPEGFQGLSKRNGPEGFMGNIQYFDVPSAPTVSVPPMNVRHIDAGVAIIDACNVMPQFRGNYVGPPFRPPAVTWCECQPNGVRDSSTLPFSYPPIPPYFEASNANPNSSEMENAIPHRYHDGASTSRGSLSLLPYTPMLCPPPDLHPQNIQGGSKYNANHHPSTATTSSRHPISNVIQYAGISHPQQGPEAVPPSTGIRIYRSHRRSDAPEGVHRHHNFPQLRFLPEEGVAFLELSGHHEMSSAADHHRDMRLDIDYMSYEELLALSEQIGDVNTGLSGAAINAHLKTRIHRSSCGTSNLEELPCSHDKRDSCVICQDEYEDNDKIGSLNCGHEYHVDCLSKWLLKKNVCPICKSTALNVENNSG